MPEPTTAAHDPLAGFAVRMSLFYGASFLVIGLYLPYFPVWLHWRGLSSGEIGLIVALPSFARIIGTPVATLLADRIGDPRRMVRLLALYTLVCFALLPLATTPQLILVLILLYGLAGPSILPLAEAVALSGVRTGGLDYGRMRLWGSVSFILASALGGAAVKAFGPGIIQWLIIGASLLTLTAAWSLPRADVSPAANERERGAGAGFGEALQVLTTPSFAVFLLATALAQSSHALFYAFGTLHWRSLGISEAMIGLLWSVGVIAEILLFAWARRPLARLGPTGLIMLGALAAVLRWSGMAFDPPLAVLFALQALHGLSFGAAHLGAIHFMSAHVPARLSATAQGLYSTATVGIGMGTVLLASGPLYDALGAKSYAVMAVLAIVGLSLSLGLFKR